MMRIRVEANDNRVGQEFCDLFVGAVGFKDFVVCSGESIVMKAADRLAARRIAS